MLDGKGIEYRYREYTREPLSEEEIRGVLRRLGLQARDVLRSKDAAAQGLTGAEPEAEIIAAMARRPTLLQRPIGLSGDQAVLGRPPEKLLDLL